MFLETGVVCLVAKLSQVKDGITDYACAAENAVSLISYDFDKEKKNPDIVCRDFLAELNQQCYFNIKL